MGLIKGMPVTLVIKTASGVDEFNHTTYTETEKTVNDVLVAQPTTEDITSAVSLYGKRIQYVLGIPKGNTDEWKDTKVKFFGKTFHTFGFPIEGIEENVPLKWHKKVMVELYE